LGLNEKDYYMTHQLDFIKMEAAGNDFILIDSRNLDIALDAIIDACPAMCDRKRGVGADGLLILHPDTTLDADYTMIYRNSDGSDAGMCGNGGRSIAFYASQNGFSDTHRFQVHDQIYTAFVHPSKNIVELGFPEAKAPSLIEDTFGSCFQVYPNTEHAVLFLDSIPEDMNELTRVALEVRHHGRFNPKGTNVNFASMNNENEIELETFERGVEDFTLACGTGAIATAMSAHALLGSKNGEHSFTLKVKGGVLKVGFTYDNSPEKQGNDMESTMPVTNGLYKNIRLEGPAKMVFKGHWSGF
jgi:diaminopimelate epimerase